MEGFHYSKHDTYCRRSLRNPKAKQASGETCLQLLQLYIDVLESELHLRAQLGNALLELGVEASVIQLLELAQLGSVGRIDHVEPVHTITVRSACRSIKKTQLGAFWPPCRASKA